MKVFEIAVRSYELFSAVVFDKLRFGHKVPV